MGREDLPKMFCLVASGLGHHRSRGSSSQRGHSVVAEACARLRIGVRTTRWCTWRTASVRLLVALDFSDQWSPPYTSDASALTGGGSVSVVQVMEHRSCLRIFPLS